MRFPLIDSDPAADQQPRRASVWTVAVRLDTLSRRGETDRLVSPAFQQRHRWHLEGRSDAHLQRLRVEWRMHKATAILAGDEGDGKTLWECGTVLELDFLFGFHGAVILS